MRARDQANTGVTYMKLEQGFKVLVDKGSAAGAPVGQQYVRTSRRGAMHGGVGSVGVVVAVRFRWPSVGAELATCHASTQHRRAWPMPTSVHQVLTRCTLRQPLPRWHLIGAFATRGVCSRVGLPACCVLERYRKGAKLNECEGDCDYDEDCG